MPFRAYPDPICMECAQECAIWEIVETLPSGGGCELWCYCTKCNVETFHPAIAAATAAESEASQ